MKNRWLAVFFSGLWLAGCKHQPQPAPAPVCAPVSFSAQIKPLIQQHCTLPACHHSGSSDGDFTRFEDLKEKVANGSFQNSVLNWKEPKMPETYKLPEADLQLLTCWLSQGAPNN